MKHEKCVNERMLVYKMQVRLRESLWSVHFGLLLSLVAVGAQRTGDFSWTALCFCRCWTRSHCSGYKWVWIFISNFSVSNEEQKVEEKTNCPLFTVVGNGIIISTQPLGLCGGMHKHVWKGKACLWMKLQKYPKANYGYLPQIYDAQGLHNFEKSLHLTGCIEKFLNLFINALS